VAQYLTKLGLTLDEPGVLEAGHNDWMNDPRWQPLRRYVEDTLVIDDPFELFIAQNLALDGQLYPLIYTHFVDDRLAVQWHDESNRWVDAVTKTAAAANDDNRQLMARWARDWSERAEVALAPLAEKALGADGPRAMNEVKAAHAQRLVKLGLGD